jgi:hypothetical protein
MSNNYEKLSFDEIREKLMHLTVQEILQKRSISHQWRAIIDEDSFWCRLLKRDYDEDLSENCNQRYRLKSDKYYKIALDIFNFSDIDVSESVFLLQQLETDVIQKYIKYLQSGNLIKSNTVRYEHGKFVGENLWYDIFKHMTSHQYGVELYKRLEQIIGGTDFDDSYYDDIDMNDNIWNIVKKIMIIYEKHMNIFF